MTTAHRNSVVDTDASGGSPAARTETPPTVASVGRISYAIFRAARAHRLAATSLLRRSGLYAGQELLLMQLWDRDGRPQSELVRILRLDASTVTKMAQRLEQQGFLSRHESTDDRRSVIVYLTPRGAALREQVEVLWADLEAATTAGMSESERDETLRVLQRLEDNITAAQEHLAK